MSEASQPLPEVAPAKKKGGSKKALVGVIALLVLGGGGGGAWWFMGRASAKTADAPVKENPAERGIFAFEPFLVNLADPGGTRFVKTTIQIVVPDAAAAEHLKETPVLIMRARSAILELLAMQHAETLVTPEGKKQLKDAINEKVTEAFVNIKVHDVLFSEFVVQF